MLNYNTLPPMIEDLITKALGKDVQLAHNAETTLINIQTAISKTLETKRRNSVLGGKKKAS